MRRAGKCIVSSRKSEIIGEECVDCVRPQQTPKQPATAGARESFERVDVGALGAEFEEQ